MVIRNEPGYLGRVTSFDPEAAPRHRTRQVARVDRRVSMGSLGFMPGMAALALVLGARAHAQGPLPSAFQASNTAPLSDADRDSPA